jgi:hypothetical protein
MRVRKSCSQGMRLCGRREEMLWQLGWSPAGPPTIGRRRALLRAAGGGESRHAWEERNSCDHRFDALSALLLLLAVSRLASPRAS